MSSQLDSLRRFVTEQRTPLREDAGARHVIVVASGKGGVGTSVVSTLLALTASEAGARVLLIDANDGVPTIHYLLGVVPAHVLGDLRGTGIPPAACVTPVTPTLSLLSALTRGDAAISATERRALLRRVAELYGSYDLIVIDGGSRLESVLGASAAGAGRLLAVTTSDRIAVAATYALIKATALTHPELAAEVLLNGCEDRAIVHGYELIQQAAEEFLQRTVALAGVVPHDVSLRAALAEGMPIADAAHGSPAAIVIHELAMRVLDEMTGLYQQSHSELDAEPAAAGASRAIHPRS